MFTQIIWEPQLDEASRTDIKFMASRRHRSLWTCTQNWQLNLAIDIFLGGAVPEERYGSAGLWN